MIQHLLMAGVMLIVAGLLLNSYFAVESIDGPKVYKLFPTDTGVEFEDSDIYRDLFQNAVSDITQLVVIKEQLETDGELDSSKIIDVSAYARRIGEDKGCSVTALYELDDIVKWGKNGVDYTNRMMNLSDFVNYFGYCIYPENFKLDEYGQLVFDGFYRVEKLGKEPSHAAGASQQQGASSSQNDKEDTLSDWLTDTGSGKSGEELKKIAEKLENFKQEQLEDLVFSYIMGKNLKDISLSREDDGVLTVTIPMLVCRYATQDGKRQLTGYADNWIDYFYLQNNAAVTVETLTRNYQRYQVCNEAYKADASNVKYMVRMMTDTGMSTYTNVPGVQDLEDYGVTDTFSEYSRYLVYYPDKLVFMGNTILKEEDVDAYIDACDYIYADTIHIWMAVDTGYNVEGDVFHEANAVYQRILPNVSRFFAVIAILTMIWMGLTIYLTVTVGLVLDENGEKVWYLNGFDRIWTEVFFFLGAAAAYGMLAGYRMILNVAETAGVIPLEMTGVQMTKLYSYGAFALYGVYVSLAFDLIWYSLARRVKAGCLWENSFLRLVCESSSSFVRLVFRHRNTVISMLLPYNIFLFCNLVGIVAVYRLLNGEQMAYALLLVAGLVILDGIVGVLMFRRNAEQIEIVEGINRIREGEVDVQLDLDNLHGSSRELAEAVNNIGEGIRKAIRTSLKDEQMKTDLITNVSHDIKTPLTSIINYVDLLKRLKIEEEPARGYINILDGKAQRLKQLTDDLVEASKISSGNIELNREKLNLTELINQSIGEFSEKLEECGLAVVFEKSDMPSFIYADSRRMWRVIENLFYNICKYALEGTRVYIDILNEDGQVNATVKNISRQKMNVRPEELTERFIRGDSSRSTEGSGLGLFIAQNLVQAQGGNFVISLDGDLFKVTFSFPEYTAPAQPEEETDIRKEA